MPEWSSPKSGELTTAFDLSRREASGETLEQIRHNYFITLRSNESDDSTMGGLAINTSGRKGEALQSKEKHRAMYDVVFLSALDRAQEQLAALEAQMAQRFALLREKYGEDVIGGMAATYLDEAQLAGLNTEEQRLTALAAHFLDENGNIKSQYAHLDEAKYVRDWQKAEELRPVVAKYEGRDSLTQEEAREIEAASSKASLSENTHKIALSGNGAYQQTVDSAIDNAAADLAPTQTRTTFDFN